MRIAFFADSYKPYLSGVTNTIEILANELRLLGHRVYIFAPGYPGHKDTDPDVFRFPSVPTGYPKFRLALPFVREIPEVDIVHAHSPFQSGLLARFIAKQKGVPFVYSFHTLFTRYVHFARFVPPRLAKMGIVAYLQSFCRGTDQIVTPSEMARRALRAWQVKTPVEVIPSGIELHRYPEDLEAAKLRLRHKYGLHKDDKVLLYAGRLSKEKNIRFLLDAFSELKIPNVKLVLVGGGPSLPALRVTRYALRNVVFTGEIPYPGILNYYAMGDIFVFASKTETQGMVLAEAKGAGLPIVALFAGGLIDSVRSGIDGYLVPRSQGKFIEHVERLLTDDGLRAKMSRAAREDAAARFSSVVVAKEIETLYNSLIKSPED
ncbi:MAG: glycosyltransferase [Candidatus Margulisbacteria bacterium]|nr:glycosyltransferase [Candidatus Margulisiibacteriota bacterium]